MAQFDTFTPTTELARQLREGEITVSDAVEGYLDEIARRDDEINAYVTVTDELARNAATEADEAAESGADLGPLHGVPVALKDLRDMKEGVPHSFGSALVGQLGFEADRTSAAVKRLEDAGAIILGKTNTPEFGHKGVTDNPLMGPTASPVAPENNAGGSSGGSAAAVAAGMASMATGSDTGGSIRLPAAACGIYGHKPSYGLVPLDTRPNAFGTKMHHSVVGPLTRTVADAALTLDVMAGYHPRDPGSVPSDIDFQGAVDRGVEDLRIGYSSDLGVFPVESAVSESVEGVVDTLEDAGADVAEVTVDHGHTLEELTDAVETTFSSTFVGVAAVLESEFGIDIRNYSDQLSDTLIELLDIGDEQTVADVGQTGLIRTDVFDAVQDTLDEVDLLVTPTTGISRMPLETDYGLEWGLALTWPFNWTGHPAGAVPAGRTGDGGLASAQIVGPQYQDDLVLAASAAVERHQPWDHLYPRE